MNSKKVPRDRVTLQLQWSPGRQRWGSAFEWKVDEIRRSWQKGRVVMASNYEGAGTNGQATTIISHLFIPEKKATL
jgi:hypothetical protein